MPAAHRPDTAEIAFLPPLGLLVALGLAVLLEWLLPLPFLPGPPTPVMIAAGAALGLGGFGLAASGAYIFRRAETNVDPRRPALALVEAGPFRFTRNPMYLGMVALILGLALAFSLDWGLAIAPALWAALHFGVVRREERYLAAKFGQPYRDFLARTRRWL